MNATETKTRRDFGRIFQRKESRFLWVRYRANGKLYEESSRSADVRQAEKLLARREAELGLGAFTAPDVKRTTVVELAQMLRDDYKVNGRRSLRRAETSLNHLLPYFGAVWQENEQHPDGGEWTGGARAVTVTADRVTAYMRQRQEAKAAPATIRNELAALKRMFTLGLRAGKVGHRPHIPAIQVSNARQGFFEPADFAAVYAELPDYLQPVAEFCYLTGWRSRSEVLPLTWVQVDFAASVVRLEPRTTKNGQGRTFPFDVLPALKRLLEAQRDRTKALERATGRIIPHVFHHAGQPIRYMRRAWLSACKRAATVTYANGVKEVVRAHLLDRLAHDFRRTAVRNLVRAGVPESVAMQLTGHKTRAVFDRYDIVNEGDLRDGVSRLAALHAAAPARRRGTVGGQ